MVERAILVAVLITSAVIVLFLAATAWRKRAYAGPAAVYLTLSMLAVVIYNFGYAMELASSTLERIMFWVRFQHWGIQVITPTWLLFALSLAGKERWITPKRIIALFAIPAFLFLSAQTLGSLNLYHNNPRLDTTGPFPTFTYDQGWVVWVGMSYFNLCLVASTLLFVSMLFRAAPAFRKQALIFLLGSSIPWAGMEFYLMGWTPHHLDTSPVSLSLSSWIFWIGFSKFRLLDILPIARDAIFEAMQDGVLVLNHRDELLDFNPGMQAIFPWLNQQSIGYSVYDVLADYPVLLRLIRKGKSDLVELQVRHAGETSIYQCNLSLLINHRKRTWGKIVTLHNFTQTRELLDRLEELSRLDGLTGAYNHRHFEKLASREIYRYRRYGGALSLILLDLDHFKLINDTYGHAAGDEALRAVVETLQSRLRQTDILARWGGEEFVILLPETNAEAAAQLAEELRRMLEQHPIVHKGHSFQLTASFGVAGVSAPAQASLDELLRCADEALYQAKAQGRNTVCVCSPSLNPTSNGKDQSM